jgi:osmotically inducible protein OsmC
MVEGPYSQEMRQAGEGINPEELLGAAQAGCFTMTLVRLLSDAGYAVKQVTTNATVHGQDGPDGFRITRIDLQNKAVVPGLPEASLSDYAMRARRTCTLSRAVTGVEIAVSASLAI